ncbi:hypothetical protein R3B00_001299 [Klebsiella pneumoniae]|nr:hypothetical protein [Klebsiella pneumoniae]ELQ8980637.1 hypothetical protein [Klebsiella pneumoniae]
MGRKLFSHGKDQKQTTKTESSNEQTSWLEKNPQYQQLQQDALNSAQNFDIPQYQLAGSNQYLDEAQKRIAEGVDLTGYQTGSQFMQGAGKTQYEQSQNALQGYQSTLNRIGNMGQSDYQSLMKNEYNSDLVNSQIKEATQDINDEYNSQVQQLNQQATATGNMGNSRAGVAQGVMAGKAQRAIGSASVQYRTAEENAAFNRVQSYLGNTLQATQAGAGIAQSQASQGLNMYNTGMNYYNQYNKAQQQNAQNMYAIGQFQQQQQQNQYNVDRQNALLNSSPSLARLAYFNQTYLPMAQLQTYGQAQGTSTTTQTQDKASPFGGLMGMAGSAVGSYYGGAQGAQAGGSAASAFGNAF